MRRLERTPKNIIAFVLLAIDFLAILFFGYAVACNHAGHYAVKVNIPEDMYLTFKEDVSFEENDETITISKGTVIKPAYIFPDRVCFYYSTKGYSIEENVRLDISEREEKGIYYLDEKSERFEESDELGRLWSEAEQQYHDERTKIIWKYFSLVLGLGIVWLAGWFFFTGFLCRKKMYVLLNTLDLVLLFVAFNVTSLSLYH